MNNFKKISAVILTLCTAAAIFTSCGKKDETVTDVSSTSSATEVLKTVTKKEKVTVEITDKKGNVSVSVSEKIIPIPVTASEINKDINKNENKEKTKNLPASSSEKQTVAAQINSVATKITSVAATDKAPEGTKKSEIKTTKASVATTVPTTKKPIVNDKINEKSVGISLLSKSDPVETGNHATIIIQGTPGKTYTIDFYETPSKRASGLSEVKADENGFASWSFKIKKSCNLGKRKVVIKENNSSNYIETSITVK